MFFGAKLIAMQKKDGGLRPVAMGETLRRLVSKIALAQVVDQAASTLFAGNQWAVGIKDGLQLVTHSIRRVSNAWHRSDSPKGFVKLDVQNAFNTFHRSHMIAAVDQHIPVLSDLVRSAYGQPSILFFGDRQISSEKGGQQGDVLAFLLYCLVQHNQWMKARERLSCLPECPDVCAMYADDNTFGGSEQSVAAAVEIFAEELQHAGLHINWDKCELIGNSVWTNSTFARMRRSGTLSDWSCLSVPCGTPENCGRYVAHKLEKSASKFPLIADFGQSFPHEALAMATACVGWSQANFYARTSGSSEAMSNHDAQLRNCVESFAGSMSDAAWSLATLPKRLGGLGLRSSLRHSAAAFLAAYAKAAPYAEVLLEALGETNPEDDLFADNLSAAASVTPLVVTDFDEACAQSTKDLAGRLSQIIDGELLNSILAGAHPEDVARIRALSAPGCADWLADPSGSCAKFWLDKHHFLVLLKLRMGSRVLRAGTVMCPFGCRHSAEQGVEDGCDTGANKHIISCMTGGFRSKAHSWLKAKIHSICGRAGFGASFETKPFRPPHSNLMIDVEAVEPNGTTCLIDTAITNCISDANCATSRAYVRGNSSVPAPAAVASRYEAVKVAKYGEATEALGPDYRLVPFVVDTLGGMSRSALRYTARLAASIAAREGDSSSVVAAQLRREVSSSVARGISELLLQALAREEGFEEAPQPQVLFESDSESDVDTDVD
jgi:hypothetical protein